MMKKFFILFPILFSLLALGAPAAHAQDRSVNVERRDADMTIHADGSVDVIETWVVNFQGGPFRVGFRNIPFNRISGIDFQSVSENGNAYARKGDEEPGTYRVELEGNGRTIYWYFAPTSNATRTFELRYKLKDALRIYDAGDQFWWKFIESERGYPIQASRVTLHLPSEFPQDQIIATTYKGADETGGATIVNGSTIEFNGGPFADGTEWEIRAQFPHGVVTQPKQKWQAREDVIVAQAERAARLTAQFDFYSLLATMLILVGGGLGLLVLWFITGRDTASALPAEFLNAPPREPPGTGDILTPALAGTLIDEEANVRDVLATLIDWGQRGIIKIRALPQGAKTADPNDDFIFERSTEHPQFAHQYERELMQALFKGETSRSMLSIRQSFSASLDGMFDALYSELQREGYWNTRPDRVRGQYRRVAWLLLVLICPAAFLFQILISNMIAEDLFFSLSALAPWAALGLILIVLLYLARHLPRKSQKGAAAAARWNAFRRYLENVENYTNVAAAREQFEKYLPYAVAFGLDKTWVEKFAAVYTPAPTWYIAPPSSRSTRSASTSTRTSSRPTMSGGASSGGTFSSSGGAPPLFDSPPSLDSAARGAFTSLNSMSASFFSMLNTTATSFVQSSPSSSPSSRSFRLGGSSSSWSSSSSSSRSSFSGGGSRGGGGGGGRSGFG